MNPDLPPDGAVPDGDGDCLPEHPGAVHGDGAPDEHHGAVAQLGARRANVGAVGKDLWKEKNFFILPCFISCQDTWAFFINMFSLGMRCRSNPRKPLSYEFMPSLGPISPKRMPGKHLDGRVLLQFKFLLSKWICLGTLSYLCVFLSLSCTMNACGPRFAPSGVTSWAITYRQRQRSKDVDHSKLKSFFQQIFLELATAWSAVFPSPPGHHLKAESEGEWRTNSSAFGS